MSAGNYILGGAILVGVGMFGGVSLKGCFDKPVTIYERQIEGDSKEYLVLELQGVPSVPFVKQTDGTYKRLDDVQEAEREGLAKKLALK